MSRLRRMAAPLALAVGGGLFAVAPAAEAAPVACDTTSTPYTYVVTYQPGTRASAVDKELAAKCGTKVAYYAPIGVAIASSRNADFQQKIGVYRAYSGAKDVASQGAAASARSLGAVRTLEDTRSVAAAGDLSAQQWDMKAIHAPEANKIYQGSRAVTVGVLDSGIEATHPALKAALDVRSSAGCVTGAPDLTPASWQPTTSDHGTHVAGTIAGKDPAAGFTGIAPGVRLASVKVVNDAGYIFPESAVCGFVWAAEHGFAVTNNSYYIDPGMFYCPKQPGDAAAFEAIRRAVAYSTHRGVLNVAAAGNDSLDLTNQTTDKNRPHPVDASCAILPGMADEVVTVSSVGYAGTKSDFSNYGEIEVTAPGGAFEQSPPEGAGPACPLSSVVGGQYGSKCGTSMASPHAAGVAALLASKFRGASPRFLTQILESEADVVKCASTEEACTGPAKNNSYYGHGLVNALDAVR
ncbi:MULTISPECIES: S8 family peptidase [unclassified Amycolatopsis]|uniref:S8 family peptidase n=1 Tax=unclassified Amycolatopsis TaxID=2618356 RepID=UPI002876A22A|nr:S8 family serine peptidase [Amycolatopsis sp. 505]MDS0142938.1 S8 family serine peptidase [Amycolatopsis sp. CM201R]